jgi:hypothetical protein
MRKFEIPEGFEGIKRLYIYKDHDAPDEKGRRAGDEAARFLRDKIVATGRQALLVSPASTRMDFADIYTRMAMA